MASNLWIAVGNGTNSIARSTDGLTWSGLGKTTFTNIGYGIAYGKDTSGNNVLVAVGQGGNTVAYSTNNGNTWTGLTTTVFSNQGFKILYDPNAFLWIAVGNGTNNIATSTSPTTSWSGQGLVFPTSAKCVYGPATGYSGTQNLSGYVLGGYSSGSLSAYSLNGTTWQMASGTSTSLASQGFGTIAYGNGIYVAGGIPVGSGNSFATSTDQNSWTGRGGSTLMTNVSQIAYGNGIFIAVGTKGASGSTVMRSTDGINWTNLTDVYTTSGGRCVAYYDGRWFIGGVGTVINYSDNNGTTWTSSTSSYSNQTRSFGYGYSVVASVGQGTGNSLAISTNFGASWTGKGLLLAGYGNDIKYNGGVWLAVGGDNTSTGNIIVKSTDNGTSWGQIVTYNTSYFTSLTSVQNVNGLWYISGRGAYYLAYSNTNNPTSISDFTMVSTSSVSFSTNAAYLSTFNYQKPKYIVGGAGMKGSINGLSWFDIFNQPFGTSVNDVYWNGTIWVGVGSGNNTIGYSYDGINWIGIGATVFTTVGNGVYYSVVNSLWIATGQGGNTIATSADGITWTGRGATVFTSGGYKVGYDNNLLVAVGLGGNTIASSTDGTSWTSRSPYSNLTKGYGIAYGNGLYVAVGSSSGSTSGIATSTDGITWINRGMGGFTYYIYDVAYGKDGSNNDLWVAVGYLNSIAYSYDGITWTSGTGAILTNLAYGVAYGKDGSGNGLWVAVGNGGNNIVTSSNGINWTGRGTFFTNTGTKVAYGNGVWVVVGTGPAGGSHIVTSTNGITWTNVSYANSANLYSSADSVAYGKDGSGNGLWVATGSGNIISSVNGTSWTYRFSSGSGAIAYGNGLWVAGGGAPYLALSSNGTTWTNYTITGNISPITGLTYNNGLWVATSSGTNTIATSTNAINWTARGGIVLTVGYDVVSPTAIVAKTKPVLTNFVVAAKTVGDAAFELVAPTSNSDGEFTYTSSNIAVATVTNNMVTIVGGGTATITATQASTAIYASGSITATLTVSKITTVLSNFSAITKTLGDTAFAITPATTNSDGAFTYTSSNTAVATVTNNIITIVGGGSSTITAVQIATPNYLTATITASLIVTQAPTITKFDIPAKTIGTAPFTIAPPTSNSSGAFTYTSSDTSVATIDGSMVTIVGLGNTTITAVQASTTFYLAATTTGILAIMVKVPLSIAVGSGGNSIATSTDLGLTWTGCGNQFSTGYGVAGPATYDVSTASVGLYISGPGLRRSSDGTNWTNSQFSILNNNSNYGNIASGLDGSGNVLHIATGQNNNGLGNTIATTTDGVTWTGRGMAGFDGAYGFASGIAFGKDGAGNNLWVVTGSVTTNTQGAGNCIASSSDGYNWVVRNSTIFNYTGGNDVAFGKDGGGNNLWIAVGHGVNAYATSTNGTSWTGRTISGITNGQSVVFGKDASGGNLWIILSPNASNSIKISKSSDGYNWTTQIILDYQIPTGIAFGKDGSGVNLWAIICTLANNPSVRTVIYSYDTTTWVNANVVGMSGDGQKVSYVNNRWFACTLHQYSTSTNGTTWNTVQTNKICYVAYGTFTYTKPTYVAVGHGGNNTINDSANGTTWRASVTTPFTTAGYGVAWNGTQWVAVGSGTNTIAYSADGLTWTGNSTLSTQGNDVAYGKDSSGNGLWVVAGQGGNSLATSTNGITWTGRTGTTVFTNSGWCVAFGKDGSGNRLLVAVGQGGNTIATSTNGQTWTGRGATVFTTQGIGVTYANNRWIAVGSGGNSIATSTNGTTWTGLGTSVFTQGNGIRYTNNLWVATGQGGNTIATSVNGTTWFGRGSTVFTTAGWDVLGLTTAEPTIIFTIPLKNIGDAPFTMAPTSNSSGLITYTSSNLAVATIDGSTVTIVGMGTSTITAVQESTDYFISATTTATLTVENVKATLADFTAITKTFGDAAFSIVAPTSNSDGIFTYTSSNTAVATVAGSTITIVSAGTSTITASQSNTIDYGSATITTPLTVSQATPTITSFSEITKTFGNASFNLVAPTSNSTGAFTYTSSNTAVATIVGSTVTIVGGGTATITASQASTTNYLAGAITATMTVSQATPIITKFDIPAKAIGTAPFNIAPPTSNSSGAFTYTSSDTSVATIDGSMVTIVGLGNTTITAVQSSTANFISATTTGILSIMVNVPVSIAVGSGGNSIATSTDLGLTWTGRGATSFTTGYGVAGPATYDVSTVTLGLYVAVGGISYTSESSTIATSTDGITWTGRTGITIFNSRSYGVAYGNGLWVAVGEGTNSIATSNDGIVWTGRGKTVFTTFGRGVAYGKDASNNNLWVAVGEGGNTIATSNDGLTWTGRGSTIFTNSGYSVAYANNMWVAVGYGVNGNSIATSTNGTTWTGRGQTAIILGQGVAYGNGLWVVVGSGGGTANGNTIVTSTDGITWTGRAKYSIFNSSMNNNGGLGVAYGKDASNNNLWVIAGQGSYSGHSILTSTDGISWTGRGTANLRKTAFGVIYSNNLWIACGDDDYGNTFATSTDGNTWTGRGGKSFFSESFGLAYGSTNTFTKPTYVAAGVGVNTLVGSTDGTTWSPSPYTKPFTTAGYGVAWNGTQWVAVGSGGNTIAYSADGLTWTGNSTFSTQGNDVAYGKDSSGNGLWVVTGQGGNSLATSTNGITWTGRTGTTVFTTSGWCVAFGKDGSGNGLLVAVGQGGNTIATSTNGQTWTGRGATVFTTQGIDVTYANNLWIAVGSGGNSIATSTNGTTWTGLGTSVFTQGNGIRYTNNLWVATGQGGANTIATSVNGTTWFGRGSTVFTTAGRDVLGLTTAEPTIIFTIPLKNIGDAPFTIVPPTSNSNGAFTYTSSNLAVATIDGSTVTIVGMGTSTITAVQASTDYFISGTTTAILTVENVKPVVTDFAAITKTFGDAAFSIVAPTSNSDGIFTYTSSNTAVATIAGSTITIVGGGTSTITAYQAITADYGSATITTPLTVSQATTVLSGFSAITKTFGNSAFIITQPTTNSTGAFTYTSSNTAVATIAGTTVTIVGGGTATITASQASNANFTAATTTATLTVNQAIPLLSGFSAITKTFGNAAFTITQPTTNSNGAFTYTSSDTAVATIAGTTVTIVGGGTATITASQASTTNFLDRTINATLTVNKATAVLSGFSVATKTFGNAAFNLVAPTSNSNGEITYTSSNPAVATIDGSTVTIVAPGSSTITATQATTSNFLPATTTANFTVNKITTVLSGFSVAARTFGDASFSLVAPTTNSTGTFTYTSSNTAVATIIGNVVTIVGAGTSTITANQLTNAFYLASSTTASLVVSKATPIYTSFSIPQKTIRDTQFTITPPITNSNGSLSYTSSNTAVATISGTTITIIGVGTSTITANQSSNTNYLAGTITTTLQVNNVTPIISNFPALTKTFGDASFNIINPSSNSNGAFTYTSSNSAVATILGNLVTIVGLGSSTITATQASTSSYESGTISCVLQIIRGVPTTNFSIPSKNIGNPSFIITPPTSNSDGAFTYTTSNTSVATLMGDRIRIIGVGTSTITAIQEATPNFLSGTTPVVFQVNGITTVLNILDIPPKTFGDIPFKIQGTTNSTVPIIYTSSDLSVLTIAGDIATIVGAGTVTITASVESNASYESATTTYVLEVNQVTTVLTNFNVSARTFGVAPFSLVPPLSNRVGAFTFTSSDTTVATINENVVTIVGGGTSTITAVQTDTTNYSSATITATLTVNRAVPTMTNFSAITKTFGDASFNIVSPTSNSDGALTYTSSNALIATVLGNVITIVSAGTCTISAVQASTTSFTAGTVTASLMISRATTILTNFSVPATTFGSAPFAVVPPTTNSNGLITYTSSNTNVATITNNIITIVGIGSSTITAAQPNTTNYTSGTITSTLEVSKGAPTITNFSAITKIIGDANFTISSPVTNSPGAFTYTSSNLAVATIEGSTVTIVGVGTSTITATQATTTNFLSGTSTSILTVNKIPTVLTNFSAVTKTFGDQTFTLVAPTTNSPGLITYTSSNTAVATIEWDVVTIVGAGTATITASQATTASYAAATLATTLTVNPLKTVIDNFSIPAKLISDAPFSIIDPTSNSNGTFSYTTSNPAVATVDGNTVTIVGMGTSRITAIQASTNNYTSDTISTNFQVSMLITVLNNFSVPSKTVGDAAFSLVPPVTNSTGAFTYTSSNLLVATVTEDVVTVVGTGTCTITAAQASTANSTSAAITASLTVGKATTNLSNFSVPAKVVGDAAFTITPPTTNSNGAFTYTSSNTDVATIVRNVITIVGVGSSTITAAQPNTANYTAATITATLEVGQGTPVLTNFSIPIKTIGDAAFAITAPVSNSTGEFTYTSSNLDVATIEGSTITIVGRGNSVITAEQASTTNFLSATITALFTINKIPTVLTNFAVDTKTFGDASFALVAPTSNSDGEFTYTSSNLEVATIDGSTITIVGGGNATISAVQTSTANYTSATITALFKVNQIRTVLNEFSVPQKIIGEEAFTLVPPTTNSNGSFIYTSSNPAIATIEGNIVTIVGLGDCTIRAGQESTANYTATAITTTFEVKRIRTVLSNFVVATKTAGDASFSLVPPVTNSTGEFTYTSSNLLVATVAGDVVTVVGTGNVIITAFQASTVNSTSAKITASLIVNRANNSISSFSVPEKTFGSEPFTLVPPTTNSNGAFTYTSSNTSVATISRNVVTIVGIGTSTITAVQANTVNYTGGTITALFTVVQGTPILTNFSILPKTVGDASFAIVAPTSSSDGAFTYTSSDTEVATIDGNTVTIVGVGTSTITATQESTTNFVSATTTASLQVNKITTVLTNFTIPVKTFRDASFSIVDPSSNSDGFITYTSSDATVANISGDIITIIGAGNAVITAVQASTDDYTSATITALFAVNPLRTVLGNFAVAAKIIGEGDFSIVRPTSDSNGEFTYTSSNLEVATIDDDVITIVGLGSSIITANQASTDDYTSARITALFQVNLITTVLSNFGVPAKIIGDASFNITQPTTNSTGAFTYTSSNLLVATIVGDVITIVGVGSCIITAVQASTANSTSATITTPFVVTKNTPAITNFSVPEKLFGNAPFKLIPPTSNGVGAFTYTSSDTSVATINRDMVTIVGIGSSTITAVQASTVSFVSGSITAIFQVDSGTPILSRFIVPTKTALDASFALVTPTTNSDGAFTYTSSNTDVATIEGDVITIIGAGTSTITAEQASTEKYLSGTITATFTVNPITTVLSNFPTISRALGNPDFTITSPTTNSDGTFTYTSSNTSVATIEGSTITIIGGGISTITAVQASTSKYTSATITASLQVSALTTVLSNFNMPTRTVGDAPFEIVPPITNGDGEFTYTSLNTAIATIAGNMVTIVGAGTATIRAVQSSTPNYSSATITALFIVNKGVPTITNFIMPIKEIGMADFKIVDPSSTSIGAFTYTSSNIKVATIVGNTVALKGLVGNTIITATQAISTNYISGTVSTTFFVNQLSPTIKTPFVVPATKTVGDPTFKLVAPKTTSTSPFTLTSSNIAVVKIVKDVVSIMGAGSAIITATQPATKSFGSFTLTAPIQVNQRITSLTNFFIPPRIIGNAPFTIVPPTTNSNGAFTYTSSESEIATIAGNVITILELGTSTITASQASTANFTSGTTTATLTVNLPTPQVGELIIPNQSLTNPLFTIVDPTKPADSTGTMTYTSSNTSIATINGNEVTLLAPGIVTITATLSSDSLYNSATLMTQFSVSPANIAPSPFIFVRSSEVAAVIPPTFIPQFNSVLPITISTPANIAKFNPKFNPKTGNLVENEANHIMIVNSLLNIFSTSVFVSIPSTLLYMPKTVNPSKYKTVRIVRPDGTTVENPLIINTVASDSSVVFLCAISESTNSVRINGVGSMAGNFITISRGNNNNYMVSRTTKTNVTTSAILANGESVSFGGIMAVIMYRN